MKQIAKLKEKLPIVSGVSTKNVPWKKQNVIFTYNGSDTIFMVTFFGDELIDNLKVLNPGDLVEVDFILTAHEYGDTVFHDVKGLSICRLMRQNPAQEAAATAAGQLPTPTPIAPQDGVSAPQAGNVMPTEENAFNS